MRAACARMKKKIADMLQVYKKLLIQQDGKINERAMLASRRYQVWNMIVESFVNTYIYIFLRYIALCFTLYIGNR